jgi:ABC-type branched-subunit amino acid transport system substrate-binding protein
MTLGAIAVTSIIMVLPGCGEGDGTRNATADCPSSPGVTANEVKLGYIYSDSGTSAGIMRPTRGGIEARLGIVNAAGGIHGRKLTYTWKDDASDTSTNLNAAHDLVDGEKVFGVVEMTTAATGGADFLRDQGVPVTGLSAEAAWTNHKNMFSAQSVVSSGDGINTWGLYVKAQGGTKALILENQISNATTEISRAIGVSLRSVGIDTPETVDYSPGFSNPQQVVDRFRDVGADTIVGALPPADFATIVAELKAKGVPLKAALSATGYDQSLLGEFGSKIAGESVFISYWPFEKNLPAHQMFLDGMARYAPAVQPPSDSMALRAYIATDLVVRGLEEVGTCPTRESFIRALRAVKDFDGTGLLPNKLDLAKSFGKPNTCYIFVRVDPSGTRFETVEPAPLCGREVPVPK